jgi:hypothetical protein
MKLLNQNKMKTRIIILIWFTLIALLLIIGLNSCSASYHFGKFLKKGGTIDTTERIISVEKVIKINGKDSIITVLMPLKCPEVQIPLTRQEIRYKYRIQRDSIETIRYVTKWKTKEVVKLAKVQKRNPFNWFWIGLGIGIFIPIYFNFVIKRVYETNN